MNKNWTKKIDNLIYINKGLNIKERNYIKNKLNIKMLRLFVNLRYAADPIRYDNMTKNKLLNELKYSRYN